MKRALLAASLLAVVVVAVAIFVFEYLGHFAKPVTAEEAEKAGLPPLAEVDARNQSLQVELERAYHSAVNSKDGVEPLRRIAQLFHANGLMHEANAVYSQLLQRAPEDQQARYLQALVLIAIGENDRAVSSLQLLTNNGTGYANAYLRLGDALLKSSDTAAARDAYLDCLALDPDNNHALLGLSQAAIQEKAWEQAHIWLLKSIAVDDKMLTAYSLLAQVYGALGQEEKMRDALKQAYWRNPYREPVDPWYEEMFVSNSYDTYQLQVMAEIAKESENLPLAGAAIERAFAVAPENSSVLIEMGNKALGEKKLSDAKSFLQRAIAIDPKNEFAYLNFAEALRAEGDEEEAIDILTKGLDTNPGSAALHNRLGELLLSHGNSVSAKSHFERALELNPAGLPQMKNLGQLLLREKQQRGAALLDSYLEYQPDDAAAATFYGGILLQSGRIDKALPMLERSYHSTRNPQPMLRLVYASAMQQRAGQLAQQRDFRSAISTLERSLEIWEDNPEAYGNLGMLHAQIGNHDQAKKLLYQYLRQRPNDPTGWLNYGKALLLADEVNAALDAWRHGISIAQGSKDQPVAAELKQLIERFDP